MSAVDRYLELHKSLVHTRWLNRDFESSEEDNILDIMDKVWGELTVEEQESLAPLDPGLMELAQEDAEGWWDVDVELGESKPPRVQKRPSMGRTVQERALRVLNDLLLHEPEALHNVVEHREGVSKAFLAIPNPVVVLVDEHGNPELGVLGLINGILGEDYRISGVYDDNGKLIRFEEFKGAHRED